MPNWAECELYVSGDDERVADFFGKLIAKDEDDELMLDYNILVPLKEDGSWDYHLALQKWGTKWTGSNVNWAEGGNCVYFQSPWDGPLDYVRAVSVMYPDLDFQLTVAEPGMDFSYKIEIQDGAENEVAGGTFTVLCEEFGWSICDKCGCAYGYDCGCEEDEEEVEEVEEETTVN